MKTIIILLTGLALISGTSYGINGNSDKTKSQILSQSLACWNQYRENLPEFKVCVNKLLPDSMGDGEKLLYLNNLVGGTLPLELYSEAAGCKKISGNLCVPKACVSACEGEQFCGPCLVGCSIDVAFGGNSSCKDKVCVKTSTPCK